MKKILSLILILLLVPVSFEPIVSLLTKLV